MSKIRVLLQGGRASGRVVEVEEDAEETTVAVAPLGQERTDWCQVPWNACEAPAASETSQTYRRTDEDSTSGFKVWKVVE